MSFERIFLQLFRHLPGPGKHVLRSDILARPPLSKPLRKGGRLRNSLGDVFPWPLMVHQVAVATMWLLLLALPTASRADITTGLVVWYKFDEASSGVCVGANTVLDASGNGNAGTCANDATYEVSRVGVGSLSLDRTNSQYLTLKTNSDTLLANNQNSIAAWVYIRGVGPNVYSELYGNLSGWLSGSTAICLRSSFLAFSVNGNNINAYRVDLSRPLNQWVHIVAIIDRVALTGTVYLNGAYQGQVALPSSTPTGATPRIGFNWNTNNAGDFMNGKIDDYRIYNRALTASDVTELYRSAFAHLGSAHIRSGRISH